LIDARDITTGHQKGRLPLVPTGALHAPEENMTSNTLLARLSRADRQLLEAHLQAVDLRVRKQLQARNKRVEQVYFIDSGVASVVANGQRAIEVGMIGREGMTGLPVLLNNTDRIPHETYMQVAGSGRRLSAKQLREAIAASATLHQGLLGYVHAFMAQTTQTALANGRSKIEERLARWLLLVHDRVDGDEIAHRSRPTPVAPPDHLPTAARLRRLPASRCGADARCAEREAAAPCGRTWCPSCASPA
jgi:CRP-like cAMP-binding protein